MSLGRHRELFCILFLWPSAVVSRTIREKDTKMENKFPPDSANSILGALPPADLHRLRPYLEQIELPAKTVIHHSDTPVSHVYFITSGIASVIAYADTGLGTEVAIIGREGVTGLFVIMGAKSSPYQCVVQAPGSAYRMKVSDIRQEFLAGGAMQRQILRFVNSLVIQISQAVLCNRLHTTERRLSKWLLTSHDRADSDVLDLTQEFLAIVLGSTRTSVGLAAIELQKSGLISYHRGKITICDRRGLEAYSCGCYRVIHDAYLPVP
jgi:CRP-like cAMP-binding protein